MSEVRDWKVLWGRWDLDLQTVLGALTLAVKEGVSKEARKQIELAIKITSKHQYLVKTILESAENEDRMLHGKDYVPRGRKR